MDIRIIVIKTSGQIRSFQEKSVPIQESLGGMCNTADTVKSREVNGELFSACGLCVHVCVL